MYMQLWNWPETFSGFVVMVMGVATVVELVLVMMLVVGGLNSVVEKGVEDGIVVVEVIFVTGEGCVIVLELLVSTKKPSGRCMSETHNEFFCKYFTRRHTYSAY